MYVSLFPCADCARAVIASGIKRVVVPGPAIVSEADEKWAEHFRFASELFQKGGVEVETLDFPGTPASGTVSGRVAR